MSEAKLTEWIKEAMSGRVLKNVADRLAPIIARCLILKIDRELRRCAEKMSGRYSINQQKGDSDSGAL